MSKLCGLLTVAVLVFCSSGKVMAQEDVKEKGTYYMTVNSVPGGPKEKFAYDNADGSFIIGPKTDDGQAVYNWHGDPEDKHTDKLEFVNRADIKVGNRTDSGWIYKASDGTGNEMHWFFSEKPIPNFKLNGKEVYAIYYTFKKDPKDADFHRYLTQGGTKRK